jgi:hypothetical protein
MGFDTMQNDELIRERYSLKMFSMVKQECSTRRKTTSFTTGWKTANASWYKSETWQAERDESICKLMAVELDEALEYTPVVLTPLWRKRLAWRLAERRSDITNAYLLNLRPRLYAKAKVWTFSRRKTKLSPSQTCSNAIKNTSTS